MRRDRPQHYRIIPGTHEVEPCSLLEWAATMNPSVDRHVAETIIQDVRVSTVFLGLDHNFSDDGPPVLFETMVFGGPEDGYGRRYSSWSDADRGHTEVVVRVVEALSTTAARPPRPD